MKLLLLYDYPPTPGGLATQGDLLLRGLRAIGVDAHAVHLEADIEKEWYYRWFEPDVVLGVGYWGHLPSIVMHPQQHGRLAVPWLVADGYIANYQNVLNELPLILVTSRWVKEVYVRDGIRGKHICALPVGCDTDAFSPLDRSDPRVRAVRQGLGIQDEELLILTVGGDAASKGGQEVMEALARLGTSVPPWKYVCKVWPQPRTTEQNALDLALATRLGIADRMVFTTSINSRDFMPYLLAACDIYAAPSRLEGFGMLQVEAGACARPVVAIRAMGLLDTIVHGETGLLAEIAVENRIRETVLGIESGFASGHRVVFDPPRIADYRADVASLADHLGALIRDPVQRTHMGEAARRHVVRSFDYRVVARQCVELLRTHLGIH